MSSEFSGSYLRQLNPHIFRGPFTCTEGFTHILSPFCFSLPAASFPASNNLWQPAEVGMISGGAIVVIYVPESTGEIGDKAPSYPTLWTHLTRMIYNMRYIRHMISHKGFCNDSCWKVIHYIYIQMLTHFANIYISHETKILNWKFFVFKYSFWQIFLEKINQQM